MVVVPTLGPLEDIENIIEKEDVYRWKGSRRASRIFRNIWYYDPENFEKFKEDLITCETCRCIVSKIELDKHNQINDLKNNNT